VETGAVLYLIQYGLLDCETGIAQTVKRLATGWTVWGSNSGFGGLGVCVLASGTQDCGFAPDRSCRIFHNGKNPRHAVLRRIPEQYQNKVHDTEQSKAIKKILVGARFFTHIQISPGAHPASCTMGTGSSLGVKWLGRGADPPPPSNAEVKKE
jgi:hypothetical protein